MIEPLPSITQRRLIRRRVAQDDTVKADRATPKPNATGVATIKDLQTAKPDSLLLIDIRKKPDEHQIPGSVRYDSEQLAAAEDLPFTKDQSVVLYCGSGNSCSRIAAELRERGYVNAQALEGGYAAWKQADLPVEDLSQQREI